MVQWYCAVHGTVVCTVHGTVYCTLYCTVLYSATVRGRHSLSRRARPPADVRSLSLLLPACWSQPAGARFSRLGDGPPTGSAALPGHPLFTTCGVQTRRPGGAGGGGGVSLPDRLDSSESAASRPATGGLSSAPPPPRLQQHCCIWCRGSDVAAPTASPGRGISKQ